MAEEWDIIMPYDVLHQLWQEARRWVDGIHFDLTLTVDYRLIVNLPALQDCWVLVCAGGRPLHHMHAGAIAAHNGTSPRMQTPVPPEVVFASSEMYHCAQR